MTQNTSAEIIRRLTNALSPVALTLDNDSAAHAGHMGDDGSGETHWSVHIVSARFDGLGRVARQRLVYKALGELMDNPIHALAIRAQTPDEAR
ncbi:BolA family protein [Sphingomicrobium astaxanthinifaciens]|uniref:BolA family protein n=1 Tax=Sphingomicrobium astaxanthinifaciens TaxID=1227949 RepID=UPI001FCC8C35|nr:BolA family protein [Sphingomicrobium astaxanthinifaciens]MCJ7421383.1 BolA family transcriptional regulator [Sphingomicrobium astaxanthinifaciens]